jgi:hypothetical protein
MPKITTQDRANIRAILRKYRDDMTPAVQAAAVRHNLSPLAAIEALKINVAQNTMRTCAEVVLEQCLPCSQSVFLELAVRMACYFVSALPLEEQEQAMLLVQKGLLPKLADMQAAGHVIHTDWTGPGGAAEPNISPRGAL